MNINEVAELVWRQLQPTSGSDTAISLEEFKSSAKAEFAYQTLLMVWREKREEGFYTVPGYLLKDAEKDIVNNEMDISDLQYFKSLPNEVWLQDIGGLNCDCKYVKSTVNHSKLLCDDDSMDDGTRTFFVMGSKIKFPQGTHKNKLKIIYADKGGDLDGNIDVDDAIAALVRERLIGLYGGKIGVNDETNNENKTN
ncbi:MAG TPA: hypothetical protein VJ279_10485 [Hanamia sp.]|nr:hypothetical protein [Hanamia sp.]